MTAPAVTWEECNDRAARAAEAAPWAMPGLPPRSSARAAAILTTGPGYFDALPTPDEVGARPAVERRALLDALRPELYAIAAIVADGAVLRAERARPSFPPYGLARSMFSELRVVRSFPPPFEPGSIRTYGDLGPAFIDTMVFHLQAEFHDIRTSDREWLGSRLEQLLALFRVGAAPTGRARIRDGFSFLYGGLHFGTSVCVQMVEVMSRLLDETAPSWWPGQKGEIINRSLPAVLQLTGLNADNIARAYQLLQEPALSGTPWLSTDHFVVQGTPAGRRRIDLVLPPAASPPPTYTTLGCPARASLAGAPSAIARLWRWSVELAHATDLLNTGWSPGTST